MVLVYLEELEIVLHPLVLSAGLDNREMNQAQTFQFEA